MNLSTNLVTSFILALWIGLFAVFSIQNITEVSLTFFRWESIKLPVGVLLSFCVGLGMILGSLLPLWFPLSPRKTKKRRR